MSPFIHFIALVQTLSLRCSFCLAVIVQAASLPITRVPTLSLEVTLSLRVGTRVSSLVMDSNRAAMGSSKAHLQPTLPKGTARMGSLSTASRVHHRMTTTSQVTTVRVNLLITANF